MRNADNHDELFTRMKVPTTKLKFHNDIILPTFRTIVLRCLVLMQRNKNEKIQTRSRRQVEILE